MQQIRVKELPVDYFVTDTYYPSGNKEFVRMGTNNARECNDETHFHTKGGLCKTCHNANRKPLGTKHIQLIAVNTGFRDDTIAMYEGVGYRAGEGFSIGEEQCYLAKQLKQQGKDFFIYEVSEEK